MRRSRFWLNISGHEQKVIISSRYVIDMGVDVWVWIGSGGGTSDRAMAFCLGRPASNPEMDLGFFSV